MPRFAATYLSFFAAKSVCIGVYPWLKTGSVAAALLQVSRVFRGSRKCFPWLTRHASVPNRQGQ